MDDLKNILKEAIKLRKELGLTNLDDNILWDSCVRIFNSGNIHEEPKYDKQMKNPNEPATEKQLFKLKKMGYDGNLKITKAEASKLIDEMTKEESYY